MSLSIIHIITATCSSSREQVVELIDEELSIISREGILLRRRALKKDRGIGEEKRKRHMVSGVSSILLKTHPSSIMPKKGEKRKRKLIPRLSGPLTLM